MCIQIIIVCAINGNRGATYCKLWSRRGEGGEEEEGLLGLRGETGRGKALSLSLSLSLSLTL